MPESSDRWTALDVALFSQARDAREQVHHALQFASAFGISFVARRSDDSHTNLGWSTSLDALVSHGARGSGGEVQLALRVSDLNVLVVADGVVVEELALHGETIAQATGGIAKALQRAGVSGTRYSLARHFAIPPHAVATGAVFDVTHRPAFEALGLALSNANTLLQDVARARGGDAVRFWPHHADIATLITLAPGRTTGAGLALGDSYYAEPYLYVNAYPTPSRDALPASLAGGGTWHTHEWVGAVLPLTRLSPDRGEQPEQVRSFVESALDATTRLLSGTGV